MMRVFCIIYYTSGIEKHAKYDLRIEKYRTPVRLNTFVCDDLELQVRMCLWYLTEIGKLNTLIMKQLNNN